MNYSRHPTPFFFLTTATFPTVFPPFITTTTSHLNTKKVNQETNQETADDGMTAVAAVPRVVWILSSLLQRVVERNDAMSARPAASAFQGLTKPAISVGGYLERIFRFANCSPSCYVVAYIYLDRFLRHRPALAVDSFNVHRLLITSVLTAVKFVDDICYNNAYFAKVGGISLVEINYLEVDFLFGIAFDLNVTPVAFASYCAILRNEMAYLEEPLDPPRLHYCSSSDQEDTNRCSHHKQQLIV